MSTHQSRGQTYIEAQKIDKTSDHPGILVDPSGFAPARIEVHNEGGTYWANVPQGGFVLSRNGRPCGVMTELEFFRHWEPISNPLADEVASVLVQLDKVWADTGAEDDETIRYCRDRLRAALEQARGEVTCERNGNNAS